MPGDGGLDAGTGVQFPVVGKVAGKPGRLHDDELTIVAPPTVRSASVALPVCTFLISVVFAGSICHTLAS